MKISSIVGTDFKLRSLTENELQLVDRSDVQTVFLFKELTQLSQCCRTFVGFNQSRGVDVKGHQKTKSENQRDEQNETPYSSCGGWAKAALIETEDVGKRDPGLGHHRHRLHWFQLSKV